MPEPLSQRLEGDGPVVLAVSCGEDSLEAAALAYAREARASVLVLLHTPGSLDGSGMRALARAAAGQLRKLNDRAANKHMLIRGPGALAVMCGAESNAVGPVVLPFWDGSKYVLPVVAAP